MRRMVPTAITLALAAAAGWGDADTGTRYTLTDLGTLGGDRSEAAAVNARGEVVGWARTADGATHAFLYRRGRMTDLETLPGCRDSFAFGVNDRGDVAGAAHGEQEIKTADTGVAAGKIPVRRAFLWRAGKVRDLGLGEARDVNNRGQVAGTNWVWEEGRERSELSGMARAEAINEGGEVAGFVASSDGGLRFGIGEPFLFRSGKVEVILPGRGSPTAKATAHDLNDRGAVVGVASHLDGEAFLWEGGKPAYLGTMNGEVKVGFGGHAGLHFSAAYGVNNRGQVVGAGNVDNAGTLHAFLWEKGRLTDLNRRIDAPGGWVMERAEAINDRGQICGTALRDGKPRAVLLTPSL